MKIAGATRYSPVAAPLTILGLLMLVAGCAGQTGGQMQLARASDRQIKLDANFQSACYSFEDINHGTFILFDGPIDHPAQVLIVRTMWTPRPAYTPIASTATDAQFTYIIFAGGPSHEAGVYTGYGFLFPSDSMGADTLTASIWDSTMKLTDATAHFTDPLGQAVLTGSFQAKRNDLQARQLIPAISVMVSDRLGYRRVVDSGIPATRVPNALARASH
jgi:hypothetical protein